MKIGYFPVIYKDELFYSALCRWFVHEGHFSFRCIQKEIFRLPLERPDINFINALTKEMQDAVLKSISADDLAMEHTMFPYYARFFQKDKKILVWENMINFRGMNSGNMCMPVLPGGRKRHLRVCPMCLQEDRARHGEAYYHRKHQIYGVEVCYMHGCYLYESGTVNSSKPVMEFVPAETIQYGQCIMGNQYEKDFAEYVVRILDLPMDFDAGASTWEFFRKYLDDMGYMLGRRDHVKNKKISEDLSRFYWERGIALIYSAEQLIKAMIKPSHSNTMRICYLAYFLGIPIEELTICHEQEIPLEEKFDMELTRMIHEGIGYGEIAVRLNASAGSVRLACQRLGIESSNCRNREERNKIFQDRLHYERKYWEIIQNEHPEMNQTELYKIDEYRPHIKWMQRNDRIWMREHYRNGENRKHFERDWDKEDIMNLPKVKSIINKILSPDIRPCRVTYEAVMKQLGYHGYQIKYLPLCRAEIDMHKESYQAYWAREAVYAVKKIQREGSKMCYCRILRLVSLDRSKIEKCLPFVEDLEVAYILAGIIQNDKQL